MDISLRLKLGKRIKQLRFKRTLTQHKLAELADIDYKYIQKIGGKNPPAIKIDTIGKLAKAFKTTPSKLLDF